MQRSWLASAAVVVVLLAVVGVVSASGAEVEMGVEMPNEGWSRPQLVDSIAALFGDEFLSGRHVSDSRDNVDTLDGLTTNGWFVPEADATADGMARVYPHPASPRKHIQPIYEQEPTPEEVRWKPGGQLWRRFIGHPRDGSPFTPFYIGQEVTYVPRRPPTVLSPWIKPEQVVGSHFPPIPDEACACHYTVSDPKLCTKWVRDPGFTCTNKGTNAEKCTRAVSPYKCPCVHADNHRKCYFWAPPGTRAGDFPIRSQPQSPAQQQQPSQQQKKPQKRDVVKAQAVKHLIPKKPKRNAQRAQPQRKPARKPSVPVVPRKHTPKPKPLNARKPQPKPQPQQKPQSQPKPNAAFNPSMVVSPHAVQVSGHDAQSRAAAAAMKKKVKRAKADAAKRALETHVAAYREKAIARYRARQARRAARAAQKRAERETTIAERQARAAGFTPVPRIGPEHIQLPSSNRFGKKNAGARVTLAGNGNARPSLPGVAVVATEYDKDVLTRTLLGEAKHDDPPGQVAVVWSLINRARDPAHRFPKTLAEVCKQRGQFRTWANPKLVAAAKKVAAASADYKDMRRVVDDALAFRSSDPTGGALFYYYNGRVAPGWAADMDCTFHSKVHTFCMPKRSRRDLP